MTPTQIEEAIKEIKEKLDELDTTLSDLDSSVYDKADNSDLEDCVNDVSELTNAFEKFKDEVESWRIDLDPDE